VGVRPSSRVLTSLVSPIQLNRFSFLALMSVET
jgi:hypothetical protein